MVKRSIYQKLRLRNFDTRHEKIETGAVVKNHKGLSGVEGGKGTCYQRKEKGQRSKRDKCRFRHESDDRAPNPTPKAAPPSEPQSSKTRGRSVSRKRNARGKSASGKFSRQPCKNTLNYFVTTGILSNVNSFSLNRDVNSAQSAHFRTGRLRNNPTKGRRRVMTKVQLPL